MQKILSRLNQKINAIKRQLLHKPKPFELGEKSYTGKNIIFLLMPSKYPGGGTIVSHHHSDTINRLQYQQFFSEVLYPTDLNYRTNLFVHHSPFKKDCVFDNTKDFVIIPEVMVLKYAHQLTNIDVKYAIHVQNGYLMNLETRIGLGNFAQLKQAYQQADIIIGNSADTIENIKTVFPGCMDKVVRSYFVINKARSQPIVNKKNIITYMPRKLRKHTELVLFFINDKLPDHWQLKPIDGVTEQTVYDMLYESKIFLSFSEFEGLAMPPAMAAMSGNKVIGYTGEANKEYFHLPCFEEVNCGDIKGFVNKILDAVARFDSQLEQEDSASIDYLTTLFSESKQQQFIKNLLTEVDQKLE